MLILFCMRGCGRIERPAFPAPSDVQEAEGSQQNSRENARRDRENVPQRHCERSEAIHSYFLGAPWIASRSLSSGAQSRDPLARNDGGIRPRDREAMSVKMQLLDARQYPDAASQLTQTA